MRKAGALDVGLKVAKGELVAIFDADFLPQPDFFARSCLTSWAPTRRSVWCRRGGAT